MNNEKLNKKDVEKMIVVCPKCKSTFDITEVVEELEEKAIDDFLNKLKQVVNGFHKK